MISEGKTKKKTAFSAHIKVIYPHLSEKLEVNLRCQLSIRLYKKAYHATVLYIIQFRGLVDRF